MKSRKLTIAVMLFVGLLFPSGCQHRSKKHINYDTSFS